jgi:hypothetical protein
VTYYKLVNKVPVECSLMDWVISFAKDKKVDYTELGLFKVSTIFIGTDHNFSGDGPPLLYETGVFDKNNNNVYRKNYETLEQAKNGHWQIIENIKKSGEVEGRNAV